MKSKRFLSFILLSLFISACNKDTDPPGEVPPPAPVTHKLKDVIVQGLPSPYYHFEYNNEGDISKASYASGLRMYAVSYNARRISEIRSTHVINRDKLVYEYEEGKIAMIRYLDENGGTFRRSFLTYGANGQLMKIEWEQRKGNAGYEVDRVVSFIYYPDGNLSEMQDLRRSINGQQPDLVYIDRFENYDDKKNAEGFSLVHNDNEHLALLPGVVLQKNNPRKTIRSGDGVHYDITYTYTYNDKGWPVLKNGAAIFKNGPNEGETFTTTTRFTYY